MRPISRLHVRVRRLRSMPAIHSDPIRLLACHLSVLELPSVDHNHHRYQLPDRVPRPRLCSAQCQAWRARPSPRPPLTPPVLHLHRPSSAPEPRLSTLSPDPSPIPFPHLLRCLRLPTRGKICRPSLLGQRRRLAQLGPTAWSVQAQTSLFSPTDRVRSHPRSARRSSRT